MWQELLILSHFQFPSEQTLKTQQKLHFLPWNRCVNWRNTTIRRTGIFPSLLQFGHNLSCRLRSRSFKPFLLMKKQTNGAAEWAGPALACRAWGSWHSRGRKQVRARRQCVDVLAGEGMVCSLWWSYNMCVTRSGRKHHWSALCSRSRGWNASKLRNNFKFHLHSFHEYFVITCTCMCMCVCVTFSFDRQKKPSEILFRLLGVFPSGR